MSKDSEKVKKSSLIGHFIIAAIAYIVLGVFMVMYNSKFADGVNIVFGVVMLLYGIIQIISFFLNQDKEENLFMELAMGVIALGLGVFSLLAPQINGIHPLVCSSRIRSNRHYSRSSVHYPLYEHFECCCNVRGHCTCI